MNTAIKTLLVATYLLAAVSLAVALPYDAGPWLQRFSLVLLAAHVLELVLMFKHVRLYRGPIAISVMLTLLFGLLHWKPLADAQARQSTTR